MLRLTIDSFQDHLYIAAACPWAHRTLIVCYLKGLEDCISVTMVHPTWQKTSRDPSDSHYGWVFGNPDSNEKWTNTKGLGGPFPPCYPGTDPDPNVGATTIRELYERAGDTNRNILFRFFGTNMRTQLPRTNPVKLS
jgi:glutathionyl-hydroquinone reductase